MKLTGVYDNTVKREGLVPGWGLSIFLELPEKNLLFDTGADLKVLENNMKELELAPSALDYVVLSHPHCDHVGGLSAILTENSDVEVFLTEEFPDSLKNKVENYGADPVIISEPREICDGVWSTGELFGSHKDQILPEQSLVLRSQRGPVVVSGCAHPGITEIVRRSKEITGKSPYLAVGGFHLGTKKEKEVVEIVEQLKGESVSRLAPTHCTGQKASNIIKDRYGENWLQFGAGAVLTL